MTGADAAAIRSALYDNRSAPNGPTRNARAEELVALAEHTGDTSLLLDSLFELMNAYLYSAERNKMFAPFARLLRMWDDRPEDFDETDTHRLHWMFKWVAGGMISHPEIPLASIEKWHAEMERRYRIAGYSVRPVHEDALWLAHQLGDKERANAAFEAWLAAERDEMSNCEACELNGQGDWYATQGRDQDAIDIWEPVLSGALTCGEEPHRVLSKSLMPLVRLGRLDEARAHHLRGYRMVRGNESLLAPVGNHIEFCALTGNEARGLEILAEHAAHLDAKSVARARLSFLEGTVILLRRLEELGHGGQPAPGATAAGGTRTVRELRAEAERQIEAITRRFDQRNGTTTVSDQSHERCSQRPLVDALPLGVKSVIRESVPMRPLIVAGPAVSTTAGRGTTGEQCLQDLLAEARRLQQEGHPTAQDAWARAEQAAASAGSDAGTEAEQLSALDRADLTAGRGLRLGLDRADEALTAFRDAAQLYEELDRPAESVLSLSRAAIAAAGLGQTGWALETAERTAARIEELYVAGAADVRTTTVVRLNSLKAQAVTLHHTTDERQAAAIQARLDARLAELLLFADGHAERDRILDRIADAERLRAAGALSRDEIKDAEIALRRSVELFVAGGRPWYAVEPGHLLARVLLASGDPEAAWAAARQALDNGGEWTEPELAGHLHHLLADLAAQGQQYEAAAEHALQATHWFDSVGLAAGPGAGARALLGRAYEKAGRFAEAASVLESALPDLIEHDEFEAVVTRQVLGRCLRRLGDNREAAEHLLHAADVAQHWEGQGAHAQLASEAAAALEDAGLVEEARRAYRRAEELWRALGDVVRLIRTMRARAWLAVRDETGLAEARSLMAAAERELTGALREADSADRAGDEALTLRYELAETWDQLSRLLAQACEADEDDGPAVSYEEALSFAVRAAEGFAACGEPGFDGRIQAEILAAWIEADMGRTADAETRMQAAAEVCAREGAEELLARCRSVLEQLGPQYWC